MKSKRIFTMVLALVLVLSSSVLLFAGCSDKETPPSESEASVADTPAKEPEKSEESQEAKIDEDEPVHLKWALWDWDMTSYYQPLIDAYEAKNPHVTIEGVDLGSADFMTMLSTQLAGEADLDILTMKDIPGYANLVRQNHLEPLNDYIAAEGIDTDQYSGLTEQLEVEGELYQLPFRSDFWVIFYNKDLFDAAGIDYPTNDMTLAEYDELSRQMTSGTGGDKVYGAHYHTWRSAVQLFGILDGKNSVVDGEYSFLAPYYERILTLQDDGIIQDYATLKTSSTHYSGVFFNEQAATLNMGTWFIATQIEKVEDGESLAENWGIVKYPHPEGVEAGTTLGTLTGLAVNKNSANKEQALDFMEFVTSAEGAEILAGTGTIPAIQSDEVIDSIVSMPGFPQDENSREALKTAKTYLEMPLHEKAADIEVVLNETHENIMTYNATIEESIAEMDERVGEILGQ